MIRFSLFLGFLFASCILSAQNNQPPIGFSGTNKFCDVEIERAKILNERPDLETLEKAAQQKLEQEFQQKKLDNKSGRASNQTYVLPIVFHIVHGGGPENISDAQIQDAVEVLNIDFQKLNADTADVHPEFKNNIGNTNIEFRLARKDPNGNPTNGINRYFEPTLTVNAGEQSKVGGWDRAKYVNIWVVRNIGSGAAGYTFIPAWADGYPEGDGIIVLHDYVGRIGTGAPSRSRTLTHEVGHWINLFHTWGQTNSPGISQNCSDDDFVDDTPNTRGNGNCINRVNTCANIDPYYGKDQIDNLENYMEYTFCYNMFTKEQALRMRSATESSVAERFNLWQESNLKETGVFALTDADFSAGSGIFCWDENVAFRDQSKYGAEKWAWSFENGNISSSRDKNPLVKFVKPGIKNVRLTASNNQATVSVTKKVWALPEIGNSVPFNMGFETADAFFHNVFIPTNFTDTIYFKQSTFAVEGNKGLWLQNFLAEKEKTDEAIIGPVDVTTLRDFYVSFKYAFAQKDTSDNDILNIYTSGDCGKTWTRKNQLFGNTLATTAQSNQAFFPSNSQQWKTSGISGFTTIEKNSENLLIKFEFVSGGGNNFFLDDIKLEGQFKTEPVLAYPRNGADNVASNVSLDWKPVQSATGYQYQIDKNQNFNSSSLKSATIQGNGQITDVALSGLTNNETYYWRVRTLNGSSVSKWSETWSFTVSPNGVKVLEVAEEQKIRFYPNPASTFITLEVEGVLANANLQILDLSGKTVVFQHIVNPVENISINRLTKGVYFMRISGDNFQKTEKLVIQ